MKGVDDMTTASSVLEEEYYLEFPASIREQMNIQTGDYFYAYRHDISTLVLARKRPNKSTYCSEIEFHNECGAILPSGFLQRMRIRPGDTLVLRVENDEIIVQKSPVIPLFPSDSRRGFLERKLIQELETPSQLFSQSLWEDVYSVLTLTEWNDEVMLYLVRVPGLLAEVAHALHNDDVFSGFFEQRTTDLILELTERNKNRRDS